MSRMGKAILAILFVAALILSALLAAFPSLIQINTSPSNRPNDGDDQGNNNAWDMLPSPTNAVDQKDIEALKEVIGVRGPDIGNESGLNDTDLRPPTETEWEATIDNMTIENSTDLVPQEEVPKSFDLSSEPFFPPVGNQGLQGSCTAWSVTYYSYGYMLARSHNWTDVRDGNLARLMSPSWTYNKANYGYDSGSSFFGNFQAIQNFGAASMSSMPYDASDPLTWGPAEAWREAYVHNDIDYTYLIYDNSTNEAIKNLVLHNTPVIFGMWAGELGQQRFWSGEDPILTAADYNFTGGGHAQTVVGYDDSIKVGNETGAFRIVNSWGTYFGKGGYYWITYDCMSKILKQDWGAFYISDIKERNTTTVASIHFDPSPAIGFDSGLMFEVDGTPWATLSRFYNFGGNGANRLPEYMCLDVSILVDANATSTEIRLRFGDLTSQGQVASFHLESYSDGFVPTGPTEISGQPSGLPRGTGEDIALDLTRYQPQAPETVLNSSGMQFNTGGFEGWLSAPYDNGTLAMRSGDSANGGTSWLSTIVSGPGQLNFTWRASSQEGDRLSFQVDGGEVLYISGEIGWTNETISIIDGTHALRWVYLKDSSVLSGEDCGWLGTLHWTPSAGLEPIDQNTTDEGDEDDGTNPPANPTNRSDEMNGTEEASVNSTTALTMTLAGNNLMRIAERAERDY